MRVDEPISIKRARKSEVRTENLEELLRGRLTSGPVRLVVQVH